MTTSPSPAVQAADDNVRDIREVFVDTETTGTHDDARPWEIALIAREHRPGHRTLDYVILLQILDVDLTTADPEALSIGRFHERHIVHGTTPPEHIVLPTTSHIPDWRQFPTGLTVGVEEAFAAVLVTAWTTGAHLIGVNPAFDQRILTGMLARHGITPAWHYHPRCVADRAAGYLAGLIAGRDAALAGHPIPAVTDVRAVLALPPSSRKVTSLAGVDAPPPETRHTAYGDADWGRRVWDHIHQPLTALIAYPARALEGVAVRLAHDFLDTDNPYPADDEGDDPYAIARMPDGTPVRPAVRCRECGGWLVSPDSFGAGVGPTHRHRTRDATGGAGPGALPLFDIPHTT